MFLKHRRPFIIIRTDKGLLNSLQGGGYYFNLAKAFVMRTQALSMLGMLLAKEKRTQLGSPKASPITEETCAVFNRYILKSAEFLMVSVPFDLP